MIAPLRRRHRLMTTALALVVPVLYVVALGARPDEPIMSDLPAAISEASSTGGPSPGKLDNDLGELFTDPSITVRSHSDGVTWWVELEPSQAITQPEVLVYWSRSSATGRLPDDAYLIGSLSGDRTRTLELPREALGQAGTLALYSLGHQEVVASTPVPAFGRAEQPAATEEPAEEPAEPTSADTPSSGEDKTPSEEEAGA